MSILIAFAFCSYQAVLVDKKAERRFCHEATGIWSTAFSGDGKLIASHSDDDGIRIWNYESGKQLRFIKSKTAPLRSVTFSPDCKSIAFADGFGVHSATVDGSEEPSVLAESRHIAPFPDNPNFRHKTSATSVEYSPDGKHVVWADNTGEITIIDLKKKIQSRIWQGGSSVSGLFECITRISADGRTLAFTTNAGSTELWNLTERKKIKSLPGHSKTPLSLAFSLDGKLLGAGSEDGVFRVWKCAEGDPVAVLREHKGGCIGSFGRSPNQVITGDDSGVIRIWNFSTGKILSRIQGPSTGVTSVAQHPKDTFIATTGEEATIRFWNLKTAKAKED